MSTKLLAFAFLAGSTFFAHDAAAQPRVAIGIHIGGPSYGYRPGYYLPPPPPPPRMMYSRPMGRPGYVWVDGYWYPRGRQWAWRQGQWMRPPRRGAAWSAPYYRDQRYYQGYWR